MKKSKQLIPSMWTSLVKHIRGISIKDIIDIGVILTDSDYPYILRLDSFLPSIIN